MTTTQSQFTSTILGSSERQLQEGEILLWEGKPRFSAYVGTGCLQAAIIELPVAWLVSLNFMPIFGTFHSYTVFDAVMRWGVLSAIYFYLLWKTVRRIRESAGKTAYALTNRRVIVLRSALSSAAKAKMRIDEAPLFRLQPSLRRSLFGSGIGTIRFGASLFDPTMALHSIEDADSVFRALMDARAALPEIATTSSYYKSRSSNAPARFDIAEHLWGGENVLWLGKPMQSEYLRLVFPSACGAGILTAFFGSAGLYFLHAATWIHAAELALAGGVASYPFLGYFYGKHWEGLWYFVTSGRIIIAKSGLRPIARLEEKPLEETRWTNITRIRRGTATLEFERSVKSDTSLLGASVEKFYFSFENIEHWKETLATVIKAREAWKRKRFSSLHK